MCQQVYNVESEFVQWNVSTDSVIKLWNHIVIGFSCFTKIHHEHICDLCLLLSRVDAPTLDDSTDTRVFLSMLHIVI